jgi:nucleotide-binding universal stress UspA family protein
LAEGPLRFIEQEPLPDDHEVLLVTVVDPGVNRAFIDIADGQKISLFDAVEQYQERIVGKLRDSGITARGIRTSDISAADAILTVAEKEEPTAILMSSHGRSGVGRWLVGSVAEKLVQSVSCPILVLKG